MMGEEDVIADLVTITRLGIVTILLWLGSRGWDIWQARKRRSDDRKSLLRALFAEIDFNAADMKRFLDTAPSIARFEHLFRDPHFVPHITDARHTDVYRSRISELHAIEDGLIGDVVRFYGDLEKIKAQIDGLQQDSFRRISPAGRVGTIRNIYGTSEDCEALGREILAKMQLRYSDLELKRRAEPKLARPDEHDDHLAGRLRKLQSDLDRVRAGHS
ncbi:hypothetical protein [Marinibacterium sp. SX1]|uniref:hypothetical protein n=1 Tax=Marinibacterium sp. SX1 TaxID=3388424 RepID=UPI003D1624DC